MLSREAAYTSWYASIRRQYFTGGSDVHRRQWLMLNRIRTGVPKTNENLSKLSLKDSPAYECGVLNQTLEHL